MKNIYESTYLNMFQKQEKDEQLFNNTEILNHTTSINEILLELEGKLLEQQKTLDSENEEMKQKILNIQISLDSINKIKEDLSDVNQQITVISDSLKKIMI